MSPGKKRIWCPVSGLCAFFVGAVAVGNGLFGVAAPTTPPKQGASSTETPSAYLAKSMKRAKNNVQRIQRAIEEKLPLNNGVLPMGVLAEDEPTRTPSVADDFPKFVKRDEAPMPPTLKRPIDDRELWGSTTCEMLSSTLRERRNAWWIDIGNEVFDFPEMLIDGALDSVQRWMSPSGSRSWRQDEDGPLIPRLFTPDLGPGLRMPFTDFVTRWVTREQAYFANFQDNPLATFLVEEGIEELDHAAFMEDQRGILLDVSRKLYFGKYAARVEERVRNEAYHFSEWRGIDFVLGPPVLIGYTVLRGFDRKFSLGGDVKLRVHLDPIRRIVPYVGHDEKDLVGALGFELSVGTFPVRAIVSFGYHNGSPELDFIGIGTSLGEAKKAVVTVLGAEEPARR